jgi:hypothetical protein
MADYCTVYELKNAIGITDSVDDLKLGAAITAASGWIDAYCGRQFIQASGTAFRSYIPTGRMDPLPIDDATSIVSVAIDDDLDGTFSEVLETIDWQAEPVNDFTAGIRMPYTSIRPFEDGYWPLDRGRATVKVQATFGWDETPIQIRQAAILQSSRLFKRYDSPLGVAGFGDLGVMRVSRFVDPDTEMLLAPFRRWRF